MVPTVERGLRLVVFCSMEMAGREAVDGVDVGAFHLVEELAGVGGEGFDVAALALGVDGVEGQGGLAGAAQAGDDGEGVARDFDADVLEVVNARPVNADAIQHSEVRRAKANLSLSQGAETPAECVSLCTDEHT